MVSTRVGWGMLDDEVQICLLHIDFASVLAIILLLVIETSLCEHPFSESLVTCANLIRSIHSSGLHVWFRLLKNNSRQDHKYASQGH